jgi:hypothetical protein
VARDLGNCSQLAPDVRVDAIGAGVFFNVRLTGSQGRSIVAAMISGKNGITLQFTPEQERLVGQAIQAGVIRVPDEVIEAGLETIRQRLGAQLASTAKMDAEEWSRELHAWVHSHPTITPLLSDEAISRGSS